MSRIGIVYPHANLDTVPSLVGAAELFAERGYDVDLFTYSQAGQPAPSFDSPRIRLRSLGVEGLADQSTLGLRSLVKRAGWLPGAARAPLARGYRVLGAGLAHGSRMVARAQGAVAESAEPFACMIGVDPDGLALAFTLARGAPVGYYSLELLLSYEVSAAEEQLKLQERALSRQASFVVVQDVARGRLLAEDNDLAWERLVLVPNAPPGPARRKPSRYWHARFNLAPATRVVVHSGSLGDWTGIEAIVDSAADWPDPWALVVHTRYDAESSKYVDDLRQRTDKGSRRVWFSLRPVPRQDYDPLIDGADVGLAFYVSSAESSFTQRNVQTIGLSSGKLAFYLRAGLPVIVNRAASISELVATSGCGLAVDDASGIAAALERITDDYAAFSACACAFFDAHLDFRRAFGEVVRRVEALGGAA